MWWRHGKKQHWPPPTKTGVQWKHSETLYALCMNSKPIQLDSWYIVHCTMYSQFPFYQIENFLYWSLYWHWIISKRIKSEEEKNIHSNSWTEDMVTLKFGGNFIFGNIELLMHFITISTIRWLDYHTNQAQLLVEYLTIGFLFLYLPK